MKTPATSFDFSFFKSPSARIMTVVLLVQAAVFYGFSRPESVGPMPPLSGIPMRLGPWTLGQEGVIEKAALNILQPDDYVIRSYAHSGTGPPATLFIAYFRSQRTGTAPHSPKNCLPGSGWVANSAGTMRIPTADGGSMEVNRHVIAKGEEKSFVLYWYQTATRTVASEYMAKVYLLTDSIRHNRSDTALVRIIVPVVNDSEESAEKAAIEFAQAVYPVLQKQIPAL